LRLATFLIAAEGRVRSIPMSSTWQLQTAKNRLSEVVDRAIHEGPQRITRRGVEAAVLVSSDDFRKLTKPKTDIVEFFRRSPLCGVSLDLERAKDRPREVSL